MAINKPTNQRPNYFAGQYLLEDDFQDEQKYHIDRQRWHHHLLHISGIAEGLKIEKRQENLFVNVSEGSAIDPQGRQIILLDSQEVDLTKIDSSSNAEIPDGTYTLYIGYDEKKIDQQTAGEENSSRHWIEEPQFQLIKSGSAELTNFIPLAKLTIKSNLVSDNIDNSVRFYSGLRLPSYDGEITLRAQKGETKSLAELNGSLSITGMLSVTGNVGIGTTNPPTEKLEINGGNLKVSGNISATNATLSGNVGIGTTNPPTEKLEISGGNLKVSGHISATNATLSGNLGIGTTNPPTEKLEIGGGNLKVSGNISATNAILSGNVGIGTGSTTPIKKLQIESGELRVKASHNNDTADIGTFYANNLTQGIGIGYNRIEAIGSNTNQDILIRPKGSGNVGISTTNIAAKLQVEIDRTTTTASLKLEHNGSNFIVRPVSAGGTSSIIENTGGGSLIINPTGGNVGIGTTDPGTSKLRISNSTSDFADISFSGSGMGQLQIIGWSSGWNINTMTTGKHLYLNRDSEATSNVYIGRNGKELFVRGTDGNVGIGTTSPGNKLSISASANHLLLRREKAETTGDKILFLELYQDDSSSPTVPEVYPSIRFHHGNRYWNRLEARVDGFHFKKGDLSSDEYRNIYAANVASCPETLNMIRGTVESNGTPLAGTGFSVTKNGTGFYTITFSTGFSNVPTVVATQQYPANNDFSNVAQNTKDNAVVVGVNTAKFQVKCGDGDGNLSDRRFHFIAIGPR